MKLFFNILFFDISPSLKYPILNETKRINDKFLKTWVTNAKCLDNIDGHQNEIKFKCRTAENLHSSGDDEAPPVTSEVRLFRLMWQLLDAPLKPSNQQVVGLLKHGGVNYQSKLRADLSRSEKNTRRSTNLVKSYASDVK